MQNFNVFLFGLILAVSVAVSSAAKPKLCVTSQTDLDTCNTCSHTDCVLGSGWKDCVQKIKDGHADVTALDGGEIYYAGKCLLMKPIITEVNNLPSNTGYYAVAVGKKDSTVNMKNLGGKKSCHTGLGKTAGWYMPMSVIFTSKINQIGQASALFNESCVPGAGAGSNLCNLCTPNCAKNGSNEYYGYSGAAKCLNETDADVAFVKHTTFLSHPDKADYKLLCIDGSRANIDDYVNCNLGKVPSHAIVTKTSTTQTVINSIYANLLLDKDILLPMFFSSAATSMSKITGSYTAYLGSAYTNALPVITCS